MTFHDSSLHDVTCGASLVKNQFRSVAEFFPRSSAMRKILVIFLISFAVVQVIAHKAGKRRRLKPYDPAVEWPKFKVIK